MNNNSNLSDKKKKLKKTILIVASVFLILAILAGVLPLLLKHLSSSDETVSYQDWRFFEADYNKNILEDELYLSLNRGIHYDRNGYDIVLADDNLDSQHITASFFYDYINCIINGDYQNYPSFYTEECLSSEEFVLPEKFTMQALYDIHIKLHSIKGDESTGSSVEYYEVSYRIFENNGTYRRDILPDETQTRVFEITINNGVPKINLIGYRRSADQ